MTPTCEYFVPGYCFKTKQQCPHCHLDGNCDRAKCANAAIPTWADLINIYEVAMKPTKTRLNTITCGIKRFVQALGASITDKVAITDEQIDATYDVLLDGYSPYTVEDTFNCIGACCSKNRNIQKEYRNREKTAPQLSFPEVKKPHLEPTQLTPEQRVKLNQILALLRDRASKDTTARRRFIWGWFAWRTGARPSDIERLTWGCIVQDEDGTRRIDYVPSKTEVSTGGKHAGGEIDEETYQEIKPFIGKPDEPVIEKFPNRIPKSGCVKVTHGEYVNYCLSLRRWMVATLRSIGVVDLKPAYVTRKDCGAQITAKDGPIHAAQMLGDNMNTMLKHYVDLHKTKLKAGL